jgi:hypothetical protein
VTSLDVRTLLLPDEAAAIDVESLTEVQLQALASWGMRMFTAGQHVTEEIETVKYNGRLVILADGTRWEVDELDAGTADIWQAGQRVVVIDEEMYLLDDLAKVSVEQEFV